MNPNTRTRVFLSRCSGFTLAELLVLVAIGAVLTGLVLPELSQARSKLLEQACVANLHQWGMGLYMYTEDYGGWMYNCANPWSNVQPSGGLLYDLCGSDIGSGDGMSGAAIRYRVLRTCPAAGLDPTVIVQSGPVCYSFNRPNGNIANNAWGPIINLSSGARRYWYTTKAIPKPAQFMWLMDTTVAYPNNYYVMANATDTGAGGAFTPVFYDAACVTPDAGTQTAVARHMGGVNVLFADGHVAFEPMAELQRQRDLGTLSAWFASEKPADPSIVIDYSD